MSVYLIVALWLTGIRQAPGKLEKVEYTTGELSLFNEVSLEIVNEETEVKKFIKENIVKNLEVDTSIDILSAVSIKKVYKNGTGKTMRLKNCYQLTEDGKKIFTEIGYKLDNLLYYETA